MNLKDYILGRRVTLRSQLSKSEFEQRINAAAGSSFSLFYHGVTGGVYFGRVRLAWSIPMIENGFRPVFRGKVRSVGNGSELNAVFGATSYLRIFFAFWYGFLILINLIAVASYINSNDSDPAFFVMFPLVSVALLTAPVIFHVVFNVNADSHYEAILELLRKEADCS